MNDELLDAIENLLIAGKEILWTLKTDGIELTNEQTVLALAIRRVEEILP